MANFTPHAQQVLLFARKEAERFHHHFIGTEHLLLGICRLGEGVAFIVLQKMGMDPEAVRLEIEKQVGVGPNDPCIGIAPYTPRVKKVVSLAAKEARALNHSFVGTEHILLGLLREGDGVAGRVLKQFGVDTEVTRQQILRELDPNFCAPDGLAMAQKHKAERSEKVDTSVRCDVYCREGEQQVVYRNILFKGIKTLFQKGESDVLAEYLEIEQADGKTVLIARSSVIKFCEHGVTPGAERV